MRVAPLLITPDDHVRYGNAIRDCRGAMLDLIETAIPDTLHHSQALKCLVELDSLRTELEIHLHEMVPSRSDPRHLRASIYSGTQPLTPALPARNRRARDAFGNWEVKY